MKRILAMFLALMLVSAMAVGFVAYADEPVAEQTPVETAEETVPATPSQEDFESMKRFMTCDFTKPDVVAISLYITGSENLINYVKDSYGESVKIEEINGVNAVMFPEEEIPLEELIGSGIGYIEDKGFFTTKNIYTLDMYIANYMTGLTASNYTFKVKGIVTYTNVDRVKGGASVDVTDGDISNVSNVIVIANSFNWINVLMALMVLIVVVLVILIIIFTIKKKKLAAEEIGADTIEIAVEGLEEAAAEIKEEVAEGIEEVKEEAEEVAEEIAEAVEEKTEE